MLDIMRAQPKKCSNKKGTQNKGDKDKNSVPESSFGQTDQDCACYCCGKPDCPFRNCPKKATLPKHKWHNPDKFKDSYQQSNAQEVEEENKMIMKYRLIMCRTIKCRSTLRRWALML